MWVCVSENFDIKEITEKILKSMADAKTTTNHKLEMEQLLCQLRREVSDKKYLLVLDDVWNEDREEWLKLKALLKIIGRKGSKVLPTTRSKEVAKIMATLPTYELDGLSEVNSWALFEKMAFEPGQSQQKPHLVKVGKEIVRKCANVPLAIKTVGSLLYGKDEKRWLLLKDEGLASISQKQNSIIKILKLSYHDLWSPLKNCFAYCALFPKDFVFHKLLLMNLWMAEGFIVPTDNESQSLDEVAEDYFLMLLQRCFFQNIIRNEYGEIIFFRMHDLIHDLAREVAGVKCKVAKLGDRNFSNKIHHLSLDYQIKTMWKIPSGMLNLKLLPTFLTPQQILHGSAYNTTCSQLITNFRRLRVLDLGSHGVKSLPSSIDKLIHLRFLNLCQSSIEKLPETITELQNLQTLLLDFCLELKQLPTNIRKLTNFNTLSIIQCPSLTHILSEIRELTSLHKLPHFIVGHKKNSEFKDKPSAIAELSDLKNLNNLKGSLTIELNGDLKDPALQAKEANLSSKQGLTELNIRLKSTFEENEAVLEGLKPHPNLKGLNIVFYSEQKLPSWAMMDNFCTNLPNLVCIRRSNWKRCQQLPAFNQLRFLKLLMLIELASVEYLESSSSSTEASFFPSLEELVMRNMKNLKGWWKNNDSSRKQVSFDKLSKLVIDNCPNFTFLPSCPNVEHLVMLNVNKTLSVLKMATTAASLTSSSGSESGLKLKNLTIDDVEDLVFLPKQTLHQLQGIDIRDPKLVSTDRLEQVFTTSLSSVPALLFHGCQSLKSISKGLKHLTTLKILVQVNCPELQLLSSIEQPAEDEIGIWEAMKGLHLLLLEDIPKLVVLPTGLQQLTNLQTLLIRNNHQLKQVPEWISCFQSLKVMELVNCPKLKSLPQGFCKLSLHHLIIVACPGLTERCQGPHGQDWSKIQHIPLVTVFAR